MEKSDIEDDELDLKTKDKYFDLGKEMDESFFYQDLKIPLLFVLKWDSLREKNL